MGGQGWLEDTQSGRIVAVTILDAFLQRRDVPQQLVGPGDVLAGQRRFRHAAFGRRKWPPSGHLWSNSSPARPANEGCTANELDLVQALGSLQVLERAASPSTR